MRRLWTVALGCGVALGLWAQSAEVRAAEPGMTVSIVHNGESAWIAADGIISNDTPDKFRTVFSQLGHERLPVIINSPGGRLFAALKIGRMLRSQKLDVMVGETRALASGEGMIVSGSGVCKSACPFILAAGVHRYSGEGTQVGLHRALLVKPASSPGSITMLASPNQLAAQSANNARLFRAMRAQVRAYLTEMGVSPALADEMDKASATDMNYLSVERQRELGLITAEVSAMNLLLPALREPLQQNTLATALELVP